MTEPLVGVNTHDLGLAPKDGLRRASEMGFRAVELRTIGGDLDPRSLSATGRRHLARFTRDLGLSVPALDADLGAHAFIDPSRVEACIDKTTQVLTLARELGVPVVAAGLGRFDGSEAHRRDQVAEALRAIGERADVIGSIYAVTTTANSPLALRQLIEELACPSIRICVDPGEALMAGHDPIAATELLAGHLALSHARDGLAGAADRHGREAPLGEGHVNFVRYLAALSAAGYAGPQILRRADASNPAEDLARAKELLESQRFE